MNVIVDNGSNSGALFPQRKTIGPDAWYNDDFDYGKAVLHEDPFLNQQYNQMLSRQLGGASGGQKQQKQTHIVQPPSAFMSSPHQQQPNPEMVSSGYESMKQAGQGPGSKSASSYQFPSGEQIHMLEKPNDQKVLLRVQKDPNTQGESKGSAKQRRKSSGGDNKVPWSPPTMKTPKTTSAKSSVREIRNSFEQTKTGGDTPDTKKGSESGPTSRESREMTRQSFLFGPAAAAEAAKIAAGTNTLANFPFFVSFF